MGGSARERGSARGRVKEGLIRRLPIISIILVKFKKSKVFMNSPCVAFSCTQAQRGDNDSLRQCIVIVKVSRFPLQMLALLL